MKLLVAGRLILIFEGFDEMANVANVEARLSHFRSLWQFGFPDSKIIFTGRPNLFFEDRELEIVFRPSERHGATSCNVLRLVPFNIQKIESSLRWADQSTRKEILNAAQSNVQILDIVARPSLLYIVAALWSELRALLVSGKVLSAQVIDRFIAHSYHRQAEKETRLGYMVLTTTERRYFHEGLAVYMGSKGATNQIIGDEMEAMIGRLYRSYPDDSHILPDVNFELECTPLKRRLADPERAIETIATDVRTHGILVDDPSRPSTFRFAHKSFYELLYAKSYACDLLNFEPAFYKAIRAALGENMGEIGKSGQIVRFLSEVIIEKFLDKRVDLSRPLALLLLRINVKNKVIEKLNFMFFIIFARLKTSKFFDFFYKILLMITTSLVLFGSWTLLENKIPFIIFFGITMTGLGIVVTGANHLMGWMNKWTETTAVLWAAVVLAVDEFRGNNLGQKEIELFIGRHSSARLLEEARVLLDKP